MITNHDKLRTLLSHWIEHNAEHAAEFARWAETARAEGLEPVAEELDTAIRELGWVNGSLGAALLKLVGPLPVADTLLGRNVTQTDDRGR